MRGAGYQDQETGSGKLGLYQTGARLGAWPAPSLAKMSEVTAKTGINCKHFVIYLLKEFVVLILGKVSRMKKLFIVK